jgi:hypothetical protein
MRRKPLLQSSLRNLDEISTQEFKIAFFVCIIIAAINALAVAYGIGFFDGQASCGYPCVSGHQDFSRNLMRLKIEISLLVVVTGLWFRNVFAFFVSLFGTLFIGFQYALLYLDTKRWLREMGVSDFSQLAVPEEFSHFGGLYRATLWDVLLLLLITAVFAWQIRVVIALATTARKQRRTA